VQGRAGEIVGVEVKLSATVDDDDIAHLRWLRDELKGDLHASAQPDPSQAWLDPYPVSGDSCNPHNFGR
jgi:hypothetical protein